MTYQKLPKISSFFYCESCEYTCCKNSLWVKHCSTTKHKNTYQYLLKGEKSFHFCDCGNKYKHKQSLYNHKKKCDSSFNETTSCDNFEVQNLTNLVLDVVKHNQELTSQNQDLTNKMYELCKNGTNTTLINNSNNKTFNLNVFLNEQCKDAMNIMDFVDSLKLQLSDLENVGKLGFVEGITNIIVKNLKAMDVHKRPVHCSDSKREVMYVKDENKWEKENNENKKLRKAIKYIAHKNTKLLPEFKAKYPDCSKSESKHLDHYNKLVIEAMGGRGNNDIEKENKIIKNIAKEISIDKMV